MPITMDIRENGWVLYLVLTDPWTVEEMWHFVEENRRYRDQCPHTVHVCYNLHDNKYLPPNVLRLSHGAPDVYHPRSGQVVLVGANPTVRSIIEIIFRLVRYDKFKFFSNEQDAWLYLRDFINPVEATQSADA